LLVVAGHARPFNRAARALTTYLGATIDVLVAL
jgi:hypothetical protein